MRVIALLIALTVALAGCKDAPADSKPGDDKKSAEKKEAAPAADEAAKAEKARAEFQAYQNKAKTTEAIDSLDKIHRGAVAYFQTPHVTPDTGEFLPCQFPASAPATPAKSCRDAKADADGDGRCDPGPGAWISAAWECQLPLAPL